MKVIETKSPCCHRALFTSNYFRKSGFYSGQIPLSPDDGSVVGENIREQTEAAIKNLKQCYMQPAAPAACHQNNLLFIRHQLFC